MDLRKVRIFQVTCADIGSVEDLEEPLYETSLERLFLQVKGTPDFSALKADGFYTDEEEARREIAVRLRSHQAVIDKQIIENDVAIAKLREGRRGSPVRPVKVTKK